MPSPRGTNFEGLYIPSTWSNPTMAMDAALPRLRPVRDAGVRRAHDQEEEVDDPDQALVLSVLRMLALVASDLSEAQRALAISLLDQAVGEGEDRRRRAQDRPDALDDRAMNLAFDDHRVDDASRDYARPGAF
jgi:hypothetical protein